MKRISQTFLIVFLFFTYVPVSQGCSCIILSLDKRFREANAVFIGKIPEDGEPDNNSLIQGSKDGVVLEVVKSWKGINRKYVSVGFNFPEKLGGCPSLYKFDEGKEYLVFAYGKDLKVEVECSDTRELITNKESWGYEAQQKETKKLDSFWFRLWARIKFF
jgi:hypothetical protein